MAVDIPALTPETEAKALVLEGRNGFVDAVHENLAPISALEYCVSQLFVFNVETSVWTNHPNGHHGSFLHKPKFGSQYECSPVSRGNSLTFMKRVLELLESQCIEADCSPMAYGK